jgi:hypothetical protein
MAGPRNVITTGLNWTDPSKFILDLTGPGASELGLPDAETLTSSCTSIQLADINAAPIEDWIAEEWRFATGRLENYQISLTFKDYGNFELYRKWSNGIQDFLRMYPDDQKINIEVQSTDSFGVNDFQPIVHYKDCILLTVSGPTLDHSAISSVGEFTVTLKASYVETNF